MILLFSTTLNAQENYNALWNKVEKFEVDNLPKSALKVVEEIYVIAEKNNNSAQIVKTLFYKSKFALILEEDAQLKVVNQFKEHINKSSFPTKNVLENVLANIYWQYFNENRWKFYQRTKTAKKVDTNDFRTWDLDTLFKEIHTYYNSSIEEKLLLQKVDVRQFATILNVVKGSKEFRPTIYDFLAHNALQFYKTRENNITKPAYKFSIDNKDFISEATSFSKLNLTSKDSLSLQFNALKTYQNLIGFHVANKNPTALVDVDLERLQFIRQHANFKDKEDLYLETLKASQEKYNSKEVSGLYAFEIAQVYHQQANSYNAKTNTEPRFKNKEALAICNTIIKKYPKSIGAKKCERLKQSILNESLFITAERYIPINKHSRLLVNYKNVDELFFTAYKISFKEQEKFQRTHKEEEQIAFINKLKKVSSWRKKIRNENDYLQHTTEVVVPEITQGNYIIVATKNNTLKEKETYGTTFLQVTNLVLVEDDFGAKNNYQVVDRNTGKPIQNAIIHLKNESNRRRDNPILDKTLTTDKNGFASFRSDQRYYNVIITVNHKDDSAVFGNHYFYKQGEVDYNVKDEEIRITPFIFTDRSIYRPGQTVYFKTIFIQRKGKKHLPFTNEYVEVVLEDANGQEVKKIDLKLNEFGSASGEIILPNNGLTGEYTFSFDESDKHNGKFYDNEDYYIDDIYHSISIEEYKRPKFATEFKPVTQSFKLNDSITINGFAKAFAGSNITDAKVVYRVHRKVQYPNWWYWRRPNFSSEVQEITHGESITNNNGEFKITFKALPDNSVSKESLPVFNYEITADVTDVNGETRSATTTIKVGYHSLLAELSIPQKLDKNDKNYLININTKNLNGEFVGAKGTLKIYKLQAPNNPMKKRSWNAPDYQDISETEFRKLFPNEPYTEDENNEENWKKGALVFEENFDTEKSKEIKLAGIKKWISGKYIAVLESKDKFGQEVKDQQKFTIFSTTDKKVADNKLFTINTNKTSYKPKEDVELQIASASKDIAVTVQIERKYKIEKTYVVHLNNETKTLKIPVKKEDIGGFAIKYHFVNYNEFKSGNLLINVPIEKSSIEIETKTFRDKLQPGQEESWSFTIKNDKKDKVTAEVLASMYDASLDEFKPHNWSFKPVSYQSYSSYQTSNANQSFGNTHFQIRNKNHSYYSFPNNSYTSLNWFGFSLNNNRWFKQQYLRRTEAKINSTRKDFDKIISGIVKDESGPLPGVTVLIKGTTYGTETDFDGKYSLKVKNNDILIFSYVGMNSVEQSVEDYSNLTTTMEENEDVLDEVVVVGYDTQKKRSVTASAVKMLKGKSAGVAVMNDSGQQGTNDDIRIRGGLSISNNKNALYIIDGKIVDSFDIEGLDVLSTSVLKGAAAAALYGSRAANGVIIITTKSGQAKLDKELASVKARKNLQETAFFYPHLKTDKKGDVTFSFTTPESLTRWKLQLLAHTKDVKYATKTLTTVTQKELMVMPNAPRFLREGDNIIFSSKISNLSDKNLQGIAQLQLTDAITGKEINTALNNVNKSKNFTLDSKGNTNVSWNLTIPETTQAVQYKVIAKAGDFSDGEQNVLPVLSNRILVTETLPMWIGSNQTKTFTLNKLKNNTSRTLKNHKLTLEMTSNPAWYAIQALPYLMEYPYECAEQTFSKYYANTLASLVANSNPRIQEVFNLWKSSDALLSNLEKNQELKSLIIQETPWLRDAQSETEQKKRIALLFDLNKMKNEQTKSINKLKKIQLSNGGFTWFKGGRYASAFITNHIASGFGHLQKLGVSKLDTSTKQMIDKAVTYLDEEIVEQYEDLLKRANRIKDEKNKKAYDEFLAKNHLSYFALQYLYMRSFYLKNPLKDATQKAVSYYKKQSRTYWNDYNLYAKGQIALIQFRTGNKSMANKILNSLKENSITSDELGMYWKSNTAGYYYYQAPVETQSLLIEAFSEIEKNTETIDKLKIWLLKNKQTNQWKTTKATTEAVYALLLNGSDWISITDMVDINVGDIKIEPSKMKNVAVEAGTGYFKTSWNTREIKPEMADITINKKGKGIAWGGLYWQYFEDLDKITSAKTPLKLKKRLFLKINSDTGKELKEIGKDSQLNIGDLVTIRIELRVDRAMEFMHMKDMRASGVEPINVLSKYKWQDGLGYYESTKDASTNFFFDRLPKGIYVFEYDVRVNNAGNFSNGITTIQSMYAPEFNSHSEGNRINVK